MSTNGKVDSFAVHVDRAPLSGTIEPDNIGTPWQ